MTGNVIHMSRWTHAICHPCWVFRFGDAIPVRMVPADGEDPMTDLCCFCHAITDQGIYVRQDPNSPSLLCKGDHPNE